MTLIYAAATPDIGFIVGDTLLVPLADIKGIPRGPVNGAHHALKIQILSSKTAVAFATENAVETSLRLIKGLYGELRADPTINVCERLFETYKRALKDARQAPPDCEFLVLQLTGEGRKLAHITKESVLHCTRAYIGDPHEYKKLQNLRQPYISPKEQSVQQPDGSFLTMPLVESAGEIEFEEIAAAMESLTQRREGTSVGVIAGCVLRIADARQSGELEYLQLHEASLTPWEGHSGFSLFASNSDTRGIGIYYQAGKMGFVFIVGDSECCRKEYAQTAKDFVEMAKKKYDLNLA